MIAILIPKARNFEFIPLFHCFGGIHRSPADLCAWLILWDDISAEDAVMRVLSQRPSLRPWKHRAYVFWALRTLQAQRQSWVVELNAYNAFLQ